MYQTETPCYIFELKKEMALEVYKLLLNETDNNHEKVYSIILQLKNLIDTNSDVPQKIYDFYLKILKDFLPSLTETIINYLCENYNEIKELIKRNSFTAHGEITIREETNNNLKSVLKNRKTVIVDN